MNREFPITKLPDALVAVSVLTRRIPDADLAAVIADTAEQGGIPNADFQKLALAVQRFKRELDEIHGNLRQSEEKG